MKLRLLLQNVKCIMYVYNKQKTIIQANNKYVCQYGTTNCISIRLAIITRGACQCNNLKTIFAINKLNCNINSLFDYPNHYILHIIYYYIRLRSSEDVKNYAIYFHRRLCCPSMFLLSHIRHNDLHAAVVSCNILQWNMQHCNSTQ